jgi:hypothetical protein
MNFLIISRNNGYYDCFKVQANDDKEALVRYYHYVKGRIDSQLFSKMTREMNVETAIMLFEILTNETIFYLAQTTSYPAKDVIPDFDHIGE